MQTKVEAPVFSMNFDEFCKSIYKIDLDDLNEPTNFCFDISFEVDYEEVIDKLELFPDAEFEDVRSAIRDAKYRQYEQSWLDDYYEASIKAIINKIEQDFENLQDFFEIDAGECVEDGTVYPEVDLVNNKIHFYGNLRTLESYIVNAINGYGMFHFSSVAEFREVNEGCDDYIEGHIHWLQHMETIYGSCFNFFKIDLSEELRHKSGWFGNYDYTDEDLKEAYSWVVGD